MPPSLHSQASLCTGASPSLHCAKSITIASRFSRPAWGRRFIEQPRNPVSLSLLFPTNSLRELPLPLICVSFLLPWRRKDQFKSKVQTRLGSGANKNGRDNSPVPNASVLTSS